MQGTRTIEEGFDPTAPGKWLDRPIKLRCALNRAGRDFDDTYDFAMRIDGVPVAGHFEPQVARAVREAEQRTGKNLDEYAEWELIAVVVGRGEIKQRSWGDEHWMLVPCVTIRIIGLHAGPVSVGLG